MRDHVLFQLRALHQRHDAELRDLIAEAAAEGIRSQDIAEALETSRATLWRHYREELRRGGELPD